MSKRPSFQFYPSDWLRDTALRTCSAGAKGLWIDMICYMHEGTPYGYLKVKHKVILPDNLARMVGLSVEDTKMYLRELYDAGVFEIDEEKAIYSKRMIRDENIRQSRACGGKLGGNPALKEGKVNLKDNLPDNLKVNPKVEKKDKQKPTPSSSSSSSLDIYISPQQQADKKTVDGSELNSALAFLDSTDFAQGVADRSTLRVGNVLLSVESDPYLDLLKSEHTHTPDQSEADCTASPQLASSMNHTPKVDQEGAFLSNVVCMVPPSRPMINGVDQTIVSKGTNLSATPSLPDTANASLVNAFTTPNNEVMVEDDFCGETLDNEPFATDLDDVTPDSADIDKALSMSHNAPVDASQTALEATSECVAHQDVLLTQPTSKTSLKPSKRAKASKKGGSNVVEVELSGNDEVEFSDKKTTKVGRLLTKNTVLHENLPMFAELAETTAKRLKKKDSEEDVAWRSSVWHRYDKAFFNRYHVAPIRNAKNNSLIKKLCETLPKDDVFDVIEFYLASDNRFYLQARHTLALLLRDAESLRVSMKMGQDMDYTKAMNAEKRSNSNTAKVNEILRNENFF